MTFTAQLYEYRIPEWREHYFPYKALKKKLEQLVQQGTSAQQLEVGMSHAEWVAAAEQGAQRVGAFLDRALQELEGQLADLSTLAEQSCSPRASASARVLVPSDRYLELRVLDALGRISEGSGRLRNFVELNHAALYSLMRRHDEMFGTSDGVNEHLPRLVSVSGLGESSRFDRLEADLRGACSLTSQCQGLDAPLEVARLAAGLGRRGPAPAVAGQGAGLRHERWLFFFLGSSLALVLAILVLIALPEKDHETFSTAYFLSPFAVFRVVLSALLLLWSMGAVAHWCDLRGINHFFLLGIDPRCKIGPNFFFSRAAGLTTCWILVFGFYVVDYKWEVIPNKHASPEGFNSRSSGHYVAYPSILLGILLAGCVWPSRTCAWKSKTGLGRSLVYTLLAPMFPVSFADNVVGDVLTSLAKPLQDIPGTVCYILSPHPQTKESVDRFVKNGDTCQEWERRWLRPLLVALPYWCRAMQCLRRFWDTREPRHLWNFGKYSVSLLVVFASMLAPETAMAKWVLPAAATVYAAVWDITMDWGLGCQDVGLSSVRAVSDELESASNSLRMTPVVTPTSSITGSLVQQPVAGRRPGPLQRFFAPRAYLIAAILDVLMRLTWVQTIMPSNWLSGDVADIQMLTTLTTAIEIARRGMWAVLRLEYEQLSNASGFRTLLWVPSKLASRPPLEPVELQGGSPRNADSSPGSRKSPLLPEP